MDTLPKTQFKCKVWDIAEKKFLNEYQNDHGQWYWGTDKNNIAISVSWHYIVEHPWEYVICLATSAEDVNGNLLYHGDVVECVFEDKAYNTTGVIIWNGIQFVLKRAYGEDTHWFVADPTKKGNVFENPDLIKDLPINL